MQATTKQWTKYNSGGAMERLVGNGFQAGRPTVLKPNNTIECCSWVLEPFVGAVAEQKGALFCFPLGNQLFSVQACYIIGSDAAGWRAVSIQFLPSFFEQYPTKVLVRRQPFSADTLTENNITVCHKAVALLHTMLDDAQSEDFSALLRFNQQSIQLLALALESVRVPFAPCQVPACSFLGNNDGCEKIMQAIQLLESSIETPLTIKELARKVAMNECYLKKGFKTITGKTIHDYQQTLRMDKARALLSQNNKSVTDVAAELGFSSISHFSTAFKRVTGLKPCELLR